MQTTLFRTTGQQGIADGSATTVSTVVMQVVGLTADSGSMTPQLRATTTGVSPLPAWVDCQYLNQATGATVSAGTAITADGVYEVSTNGCSLGMNVTALTAGWTGYVAALQGPSGMSSGSGGGVSATVSGTDADNAANSTAKLPVIPARANAAAPTWTEGHEAPLSVDLAGNLRMVLMADESTSAGSKSTVAQVSVASTAGGTLIIAANTARKSVTIINGGSATIYLGNSGLTTSNGFPLVAGASVSDVTTTDAWYGIVASTSVVAGVIEVS